MKQKNADDDGSVTATGTLDDNRDPISDAPGAHPVGVGVGAAGGAAAGAAVGSVAGPVGTLVGGAVGAVAGGLAGKGVAEAVNPTVEDAYWRDNYKTREYVEQGAQYDAYQPAYRYGWESYGRHEGRTFDEVERELGRDWDARPDRGPLSWDKARHAVRDAWERIDQDVVNKR